MGSPYRVVSFLDPLKSDQNLPDNETQIYFKI